MDLSVIIRCKNDERIFSCLNSIDEETERVVVLNSQSDLESRIVSTGARCVQVPERNLSVVSNAGIEASRFEKMIIVDSDTKFESGCLRMVNEALIEGRVARATVHFAENQNKVGSHQVSRAREFTYRLPLAFTPGLAFRKDILHDVGGFFFNPMVPFAVDADLDFRIKRAGIDVKYLESATIVHDVETLRHDLRAAYRIGKGCNDSARTLSGQEWIGLSEHQIGKQLKAVKPENWGQMMKSEGVTTLAYQMLWDFRFWCGYMMRSLVLD
jgi:glycosyltransferase involved in cell wall biosynthesis